MINDPASGIFAEAGDGHWITGTITIVVAYAASLLIVDRLLKT